MLQLLDSLLGASPVAVAVGVAVLIGLLTLIYFVSSGRRRALGHNVLLVGVCDSGKTVLFTKLVYRQFKQTHTSMKENTGTAHIDRPQGNASISLVDLPGHERVRYQLLEKYRATARAIAFVVDSATVQKDIKDVAEYLYNILIDEVFSSNRPPLLIVCNKQDLTLAKGQTVVKSLLEKELNNLRVTQAAALSGTDGVGSGENRQLPVSATLAKQGGDFQFAHLGSWKVSFCECSAKGESESAASSNAGEATSSSMEEMVQWLGSLN